MRNFLLSAACAVLLCAGLAHAQSPASPAEAAAGETALAFPGAEGAGRFTTGGRGGAVVHVTNLKAEGPGSLAEAVSEGNRIVVFDISGIVDLASEKNGKLRAGKILVEKPNITIAGQT
ncbi:MAG TPA: hypothetical protein VHY20_12915, partial [Pirellulales bacterium]|nr:hypothetical protein [Pirellulales bacterium]